MTTLLIDGDILAYTAAFAIETPICWDEDNDLWSMHFYAHEGYQIIADKIAQYQDELNADKVVVALSDNTNWRKDILPTYKANRKKQRKPVGLSQMRHFIEDNYKTFIRPGLEADDILGIAMTCNKVVKDPDKIIVSIDKDFKTIPGKICILREGQEITVQEITKEEADYNHLFQSLTGDSADGYSGCPGVGPKTAEKVLGDDPTWENVVKAYEKKGLTEEDALVQAQVARILRANDYDFEEKQPIPWVSN